MQAILKLEDFYRGSDPYAKTRTFKLRLPLEKGTGAYPGVFCAVFPVLWGHHGVQHRAGPAGVFTGGFAAGGHTSGGRLQDMGLTGSSGRDGDIHSI